MSKTPTITNRVTLLLVFLIVFSATIGITYIYYMNKVKVDAVVESRKAMLDGYKRSLAYSIKTISDILGEQLETIPEDQHQQHIQKVIKNLQYNKDWYYFVYTMDGINIAHPYHPEFTNTNRFNHTDSKGNAYIAALAKAAAAGGGYTTYWFSKPNQAEMLPKLAYAKRIPNTELWISTGVYIDAIDAEQTTLTSKLENHVHTAIAIVSLGTLFILFFVVLPISFYMINSIVTPWKQMEKELQHAQKMEAIGIFAGGIAHDFNNILGAIISCCELVMLEIKKTEPVCEDLSRILQAANRGKALVRRIKSFSTRNNTHVQLVRPAKILRECMHLLESFIPPTIDVSVRSKCQSALIQTDPDQYLQILMNLCTNAVQAMSGTKGKLQVELTIHDVAHEEARTLKIPARQYVALTVQDSGTGIPQEHLDKIFDPFFTTRNKIGGTGLGLSIISSIIKQHKGHISVQSIMGEGTTFTVLFPYAGRSQEQELTELSTAPIQGGSEHILFVDDDEDVAYPVAKLLKHFGYSVAVFTNSNDALDAFLSRPEAYDLLLTDQMMPELTGLELIRKVHDVSPSLPTILCSGLERGDMYENDAEVSGVSRFFSKPFEPVLLCEAIRTLFDERSTSKGITHGHSISTHN